jgi:AcrR family transcriptional regulator
MATRSATDSPRRLRREDRERLILTAAGEAFGARGFHGSSMDDIAHAAGITKPLLYRYFGSKEGLYAAYVRMSGEGLLRTLRTAATREDPQDVRLRAGLRAFLAYVEEHRERWTVLHGEASAPVGAEVSHQVARLRGRLVSMLQRTFGDEAFAVAFAGATESLATWWVAQPRRSIDEAVDLLMRLAAAAQ